MTGLLVAQLTAGFVVTVPIILLVIARAGRGERRPDARLACALFDRESILTRWK